MENLIDMVREFGNLSYDAGVHERDEGFIEKADSSKRCFQKIIRLIGHDPVETKDVPCELCQDAELNERNFCHYCGRDLRNN